MEYVLSVSWGEPPVLGELLELTASMKSGGMQFLRNKGSYHLCYELCLKLLYPGRNHRVINSSGERRNHTCEKEVNTA